MKILWLITYNSLSLFADHNYVSRSRIQFLAHTFKTNSFLHLVQFLPRSAR